MSLSDYTHRLAGGRTNANYVYYMCMCICGSPATASTSNSFTAVKFKQPRRCYKNGAGDFRLGSRAHGHWKTRRGTEMGVGRPHLKQQCGPQRSVLMRQSPLVPLCLQCPYVILPLSPALCHVKLPRFTSRVGATTLHLRSFAQHTSSCSDTAPPDPWLQPPRAPKHP